VSAHGSEAIQHEHVLSVAWKGSAADHVLAVGDGVSACTCSYLAWLRTSWVGNLRGVSVYVSAAIQHGLSMDYVFAICKAAI
jgi:hypothetical protein